ncbi:MAG TPA: glycerol-3-phosphate 1-O-acyltransferase PlsY [Pusillimonas sp.]|uniref:glycerol-3-phosphate 1-O-acyltransferase PlsY n=1 Tax=Pusillimonas sp. TaxID=3040095 RepID=UPI002B4B5AC6|nr:glycerol-3-phosphate 1-O-acyltransferase PlsY [Pusillimonas sp.]HLU20394.1 glycerol-3-phosphate 1-O-acyltransferase PlsY [Pusillimonas sp.]
MSSISLTLVSVVLLVLAYLLGSIPFAVVVSRAMGLKDPRSYGSRNPGATNVLRTGNRAAAALTLLGDAAKGWLAVWLAVVFTNEWHLPSYTTGLAGIAVFLGHLYPIFLKFRGGKGVATALGVLLGFQPLLALAVVATWIIVAFATRYSSLAAVIAAIFAPLYYLFGGGVAWRFSGFLCLCIIVISVLLCFRHQANIARLLAGKEDRIGARKDNHPAQKSHQRRAVRK